MLDCRVRGPIFDTVDTVLATQPDYHRFRRGELSQVDYAALVDRCTPQLLDHGVPFADTRFAKRYPWSAERFVRTTLADLASRSVIDAIDFDERAGLTLARRLAEDYDHGDYHTYIYPEEGRLLFALASIVRPAHAVFLGSYYGYWAAFAIPPIVEAGGTVTLVDPDHRCNDAALRASAVSPHSRGVRIVTATGEDFLREARGSFDFVVLDAEGPRNHPDPGQRGKCVYASLLRACLPRLASGARLVCHNILFEDVSGDAFFDGIRARNRRELGPFLAAVHERFGALVECASTEGVGIGRWSERA